MFDLLSEMFDLFSQILEVLAPFIVATHLLFILAVSVICSLVVILLSYYLVRSAGFAISWQPKGFVGAPRNHHLCDSSVIPGTTANERHATACLPNTAPVSILNVVYRDETVQANHADKLQKQLLDAASESARRIRAKRRLSKDDVLRLRTVEDLMQKIRARRP